MLLIVTAIALYFPTHAIYEPWQQERLRISNHIYYDFTVLAQLSEGDSVAKVCSKYETIKLVDRLAAREQLIRLAAAAGNEVESNDQFYEYSLYGKGNVGYLQFRNGKLVNQPHVMFADPVANTLRNGSKLPGFMDRVGLWPVYAAIVTLLLLLWIAIERTIEKNSFRRTHQNQSENRVG